MPSAPYLKLYFQNRHINMASRGGIRNALGDITKQQNIPQKVALADVKVTTRLAAAKRLHSDVESDDLVTERSFIINTFSFGEVLNVCTLYSLNVTPCN